VPSLAAWLLINIDLSLRTAGTSLFDAASKFSPGDLAIRGVFALNQGFIFTSMIFAALLVYAAERQWLRVAAWALVASLLSFLGVIHAWTLTPLGLQVKLGWAAAPDFALAYLGLAVLAVGLNLISRNAGEPEGGRRFFDKRSSRGERASRVESNPGREPGQASTGTGPRRGDGRRRRDRQAGEFRG